MEPHEKRRVSADTKVIEPDDVVEGEDGGEEERRDDAPSKEMPPKPTDSQ